MPGWQNRGPDTNAPPPAPGSDARTGTAGAQRGTLLTGTGSLGGMGFWGTLGEAPRTGGGSTSCLVALPVWTLTGETGEGQLLLLCHLS